MTPGVESDPPGDRTIIRYEQVLPLLVAACPSFEASDEARHVSEPDGDFLAVSHFVAHLIARLGRNEPGAFRAVFAVVELVLAEGDDEARSLIQAGFLHELTRLDWYRGSGLTPRDFLPWLGPRAQRLGLV